MAKFTKADAKADKLIRQSKGFVKDSNSPKNNYRTSQIANMPFYKTSQVVGSNVNYTAPMFFSPLHTPQNWQIASKRREIYNWVRFYYDNDAKIAAGIDFYSSFPLNAFKLQCKSKKILRFYEKLVEDLKLSEWLRMISHEYYLIGDVFVFMEIDCKHCGGRGVLPNGQPCRHPDGKPKRLLILNPDWIEVQSNVLADEPLIAMVPDEDLRNIVMRKKPESIYRKLPREVISAVLSGTPIILSNRCTSHLKHNGSPYGLYGTSLIRRLFTVLAYKTKLMTANWIVAERLVLPVKIAKVGSDARPATEDDLASISSQLSQVANDPNLTLVTHHNFEMDWVGASGKIHNINQELEQIGKEILDGLMLNQALLNGEGPSWGAAQVGVESMIQRLETWRNILKEWVERTIFLPTAMMQGFIDEDLSKETGETEYLYPKLKWNPLNLRDNSNHLQMMNTLHDKKLISNKRLLQEFDIEYDQMLEEMRDEQAVIADAFGGMGAPQQPAAGAMGGLGGLGGALSAGGGSGLDLGAGGAGMPPGGPGGAPGAPGDLGAGAGSPGGDFAGGPSGGIAPPAGGSPAVAGNIPKITKRGKGKKLEEQMKAVPAPKAIRLTGLERKLLSAIYDLNLPYQLFGQYQVKTAFNNQPYVIDFAYPKLGLGFERDGEIYHSSPDKIERDRERDIRLAKLGWTILRFKQDAIEDSIEQVKSTIANIVKDAEKTKKIKKAEVEKGYDSASLVVNNIIYRHVDDDDVDDETILER